MRFPSGRRITFRGPNPGPEAAIRLHHPRVIRRLFFGGDIGLAEGYMADEWDCRDLTKVLAFGAANLQAMDRVLAAAWPRRLLNRLYHSRHANTCRGSRRNIAAHYDLGNTFTAIGWTDDDLFRGPVRHQTRTWRWPRSANTGAWPKPSICRPRPCAGGWLRLGRLRAFAARTYGCRVTGLTLSKEQAAHATAKVPRRLGRPGRNSHSGLSRRGRQFRQNRLDRDVRGGWRGKLADLLQHPARPVAAGRPVGLQAITIADDAFPATGRAPILSSVTSPRRFLASPG